MIVISSNAHVSRLADIEDSVRGSEIFIDDFAVVDSFVKIKPAGGAGNCYVGKRSVINSGCVIYTGNGVHISDDVAVAANCVFAPVNHEFKEKKALIMKQGFQPSRGGIIVESDVWIGAGSIILDGAVLRQGCVIGAGSLVRGEVPAYSINVGNPLVLKGWRN
ncbi:acyltransferase [Halomonas pacifica]|uniref:Acetyltransferase n=1 Tax=Bisbaumannia pacifica TaxID=77098 RepID=A0A510X9Q6_9GAMM|nr:acyltransferase [Halomonas pacifica]MBH8579865.1 acyltransferase [Halomonas pacifica]MDC8803467.1 acyltransferase [Halomonas pacifica]GEK48176.1 acetyltransferase [Halomonas pacifica]